MKKTLVKFMFLIVAVMFFVSCEEDEEKIVSIVGTWTVESVSADMTIDGLSFMDYYTTTLGVPESIVQLMYNEFKKEIESMSGSIELKEDGTYVENFEDGNDGDGVDDDNTGLWEISADNKVFTVDKGTEDEMVFNILTLTDSKLVMTANTTEYEDLNEDGIDETMVIAMTMSLVR